jgi:hypothetical protein
MCVRSPGGNDVGGVDAAERDAVDLEGAGDEEEARGQHGEQHHALAAKLARQQDQHRARHQRRARRRHVLHAAPRRRRHRLRVQGNLQMDSPIRQTPSHHQFPHSKSLYNSNDTQFQHKHQHHVFQHKHNIPTPLRTPHSNHQFQHHVFQTHVFQHHTIPTPITIQFQHQSPYSNTKPRQLHTTNTSTNTTSNKLIIIQTKPNQTKQETNLFRVSASRTSSARLGSRLALLKRHVQTTRPILLLTVRFFFFFFFFFLLSQSIAGSGFTQIAVTLLLDLNPKRGTLQFAR